MIFGVFGWLFGERKPVNLLPPSTSLVLVPENGPNNAGGTWRSVCDGPKGYVELIGDLVVTNTSRDLIEVVMVDVRRAGAIGGASDVRARFVPCDVNAQKTVPIQFVVCSSPVFPLEDDFLLADVILSDHEGVRHKLKSVRFRRTTEKP